MNKKTRLLWAEKTFELTNIGAGIFLFGQIFTENGVQVIPVLIGSVLVAIGYGVSYILLKGR